MTARSLGSFDPDIVQPWQLGKGRRGALLLHGFAGTPPELRNLGERLASAGWRCSGPTLAGHGSIPEDLERTSWQDWAASAQRALDELFRECDQVVVAGQSTGGTIALHLAATDLRVTAVACLATPIWLSGRLQKFLPVGKYLVRWNRPEKDVDLYRLEGIDELWSYGLRSTRSIHELKRLLAHVREELVAVRAPVLVCHGERDRVIDPGNAADLERQLLCSSAVRRLMFPRSGHGMSVDIDREHIEAEILDWFDRYCPDQASSPLSASMA